jgi:translation initiation factor eIF-2B subunit epsilon
MPPKSSSGKEKDLGVEEEILQAVILADSFNKRFRPLTQTTPRVRGFFSLASPTKYTQ